MQTDKRRHPLNGSKIFSLVETSSGNKLIESNDRYYDLIEIRQALNEHKRMSINNATDDDIISLIDEGVVDSEGIIINETRYDWSHVDPMTGMPREIEHPEDKIHLMNQLPGRTGWIVLLQNRVNLNSTGNIRYARKVWYDRLDRTVSTDEQKEDAVYIKRYVLPGAGYPQGWLEPDIYTQLTHHRI